MIARFVEMMQHALIALAGRATTLADIERLPGLGVEQAIDLVFQFVVDVIVEIRVNIAVAEIWLAGHVISAPSSVT